MPTASLVVLSLLLPIVFSLHLTQSPTLSPAPAPVSPPQSTTYQCRDAGAGPVLSVCDLCAADTAYYVPAGGISSTQGLFDSDTYLLILSVTTDMSQHLPVSNYTIAGNFSRLCISAIEFTSRPDFEDMFQYFGGLQMRELAVPEIFQIRGRSLFEYITMAVEYQQQQLVYDAVDIVFQASGSGVVNANITLNLDNFVISSQNRSYIVTYQGLAQFRAIRTPFSIVVPYSRAPGMIFRVNLGIYDIYTVRDWLGYTSPASNCLALSLPQGISTLQSILVQGSFFDFRFNARQDRAVLTQILTFFSVPSFSFGPRFYMQSAIGEYIVNATGNCSLYINGQTSLEVDLAVAIVSQTGSWYVTGGLAEATENLTFAGVETGFLSGLYPITTGSLFPAYASEEVDLSSALRYRELQNARFRFYYAPSLYINIIANILWEDNREAVAQIMIGSVENVVESVITISQIAANDTVPGDSDISLGALTTVISTGFVNLTEYPYMTGEGRTGVDSWLVGTYASTTITRARSCVSRFCALLQSASAQVSFSLSGNLINGQLSLSSPFPTFQLAPGVNMSENAVLIEFQGMIPVLSLQGAFFIRSDSRALNRFSANLTDSEGNVTLSARLENIWTDVFDVPFLYISSLTIQGIVTPSGLQNTDMEGLGLLGTACYDQTTGFDMNNCLLTRVSVSLDPFDFRRNFLTLRINRLSLSNFLSFVVGATTYDARDIPIALRGLDLSRSIDVLFTYSPDDAGNRILIVGNVRYFGVQGWLQASLTRLGAGAVEFTIDLQEFFIAETNVFIATDSRGRLRMSLSFEETDADTRATVSAAVQMWGMTANTEIVINDEGFRAQFSGTPFLGLYAIDLEITSLSWTDFVSSTYQIQGLLSMTDLTVLIGNVRQDLLFWVQQGMDALVMAMNWANNATATAAAMLSDSCEPSECPASRQCIDLPTTECVLVAMGQRCDGGKPTCQQPELSCTSYEDSCIIETQTCAQYSNDLCVSYESQCQETSSTCVNWTLECSNVTDQSCGSYTVFQNSSQCLEYQTRCDTQVLPSSACENECRDSQIIYETAEAAETEFIFVLNFSNAQLRGFRVLSSLLANLNFEVFSIAYVAINTTLDSPGIGESDVNVGIAYNTYDLSLMRLTPVTTAFAWNFQQEIINELALLRAARAYITQSDLDLLDQRLVLETPYELMLENFNQTPSS